MKHKRVLLCCACRQLVFPFFQRHALDNAGVPLDDAAPRRHVVSTHEQPRPDVTRSDVTRRSSRKSKHESEKQLTARDVTPSKSPHREVSSRKQSVSPAAARQQSASPAASRKHSLSPVAPRQKSVSPAQAREECVTKEDSPIRISVDQYESEYATVDQLQEAENDGTLQVRDTKPISNLSTTGNEATR